MIVKWLWFICTLIPAPFLFHFYEYGQHINREDAPFLLIGTIAYIVLAGALAKDMNVRSVLLANVATAVLSLLLAMYFIPNDDGWFKPFGRDVVVMLTMIPLLIGQLLVRFVLRGVTKLMHAN